MTGVLAVFRREMVALLLSPLGWVLLTLFLLVQGYSFYLFMELINQPYAPHGAVMQFFFGGTFLYWLFLIFIVAVTTMRSLAEECRSGTIETLLTAPITEAQVVLGKYLASLTFYLVLWLPTVVYAVIVGLLSAPSPVSWGPILAGYVGTLAVGAACLAIGLLASALAKSQIVAAVLTFTALSLFLLAGVLRLFVRSPALGAIIDHLNLFDHMEEFSRGIVDSRRLVLYGSLILFCLTAATKALARGRWR